MPQWLSLLSVLKRWLCYCLMLFSLVVKGEGSVFGPCLLFGASCRFSFTIILMGKRGSVA